MQTANWQYISIKKKLINLGSQYDLTLVSMGNISVYWSISTNVKIEVNELEINGNDCGCFGLYPVALSYTSTEK